MQGNALSIKCSLAIAERKDLHLVSPLRPLPVPVTVRCPQKLATAALSVGHVSNIGSSRAISNACLKFGPRLQSRVPQVAIFYLGVLFLLSKLRTANRRVAAL